jgi:hypothetical protein
MELEAADGLDDSSRRSERHIAEVEAWFMTTIRQVQRMVLASFVALIIRRTA